VTETFAPEINGVAMTLGRLIEGLLARDCSVEVFRPRQSHRDQPRRNGHYHEHVSAGMRLPMYPDLRLGFPAGRRLRAAWRARRPDVIYIATEGPLGRSAITAAAALGLPTLSGFHTNFQSYSRHYKLSRLEPIIQRYLRNFHRRSGCTLVPTEALATQLREQSFGCVDVLPRGVDTALFNPAKRRHELRAQWGADTEQLVCLYVGRIAAEKSILSVVDAFRAIQQHTPSARLVLVGDGPMRDSLARRHPDFIFCGMRRGEDLAEHYASGDLFLFPSQTETFGNVVTEAMASGLAVVAYRLAAAGEHIRDGDNGALAADHSNTAFARRATEVSLQTEQRRRMGRCAAEHAATLGWPIIVERFVQHLNRQIAGDSA